MPSKRRAASTRSGGSNAQRSSNQRQTPSFEHGIPVVLHKIRTVDKTAELLGTRTRAFHQSGVLPARWLGRLVCISDVQIAEFLAATRTAQVTGSREVMSRL